MKRLVVFGAALMAAALAARPAAARIVDLHAGLRGGGIVGWGSDSRTPDFFEKTRGAGAGFEIGAKLLVLDLSANFLQVFDGSGQVGTLTQFLLGFEVDVPAGDAKLSDGHPRNIFRPGIAAGFAFGTPGPVHPPLDNAQVSDKGFVSHVKIAYEHFVGSFLGIGLEGNAGYHYFLGGQVVTDSKDHSSGYHLVGLATLTFHLGW